MLMNKYQESVIKQKLTNGFTYYVRKNNIFKRRVTMALIVKVGSVHEKENEKGIAHFLEHMHMSFHVFNIYPNIQYKTKAYTNFFETIFYINCSNNLEDINRCLEIFRNIAKGKFLKELYFNKTKNDVRSEILNYKKYKYVEKRLFSLLLKDSSYINFLPIGKIEDISNMSYECIVDFHNTFYLSNLMSIAIVGDIEDAPKIEKLINIKFNNLKERRVETPSFSCKIPKYDSKIINKIEIKNAEESYFEVYFKIERSKITDYEIIDIEIMEKILFASVEVKIKKFLNDSNIDLEEIVCQKLDFDLFHMFYVIKIKLNDSKNEIIERIFYLISVFLRDISVHIDESYILNMIGNFKGNLKMYENNYYDSISMHNLLLECINDYTLKEAVYNYSDKYRLFMQSIDRMNFDIIYSYLNYWVNQCDKIYIAKIPKNE